jgi:MFS family permease
VLFSGLLVGGFLSMAPYYTNGLGLDISQTARFMTVLIIGGLVLQWPLGRLSDIIDRRIVILGICLVAAAICIGFVSYGDNSYVRLLLAAAYGGVCFTLYPVSVAYMNDYVDDDQRVGASAGLLLAYSFGASVGPISASAVMSWLGPEGLFIHSAGAAGAVVLFVIWRMAQRETIPLAEQTTYISMPRTSSVVYELDPLVKKPSGRKSRK